MRFVQLDQSIKATQKRQKKSIEKLVSDYLTYHDIKRENIIERAQVSPRTITKYLYLIDYLYEELHHMEKNQLISDVFTIVTVDKPNRELRKEAKERWEEVKRSRKEEESNG